MKTTISINESPTGHLVESPVFHLQGGADNDATMVRKYLSARKGTWGFPPFSEFFAGAWVEPFAATDRNKRWKTQTTSGRFSCTDGQGSYGIPTGGIDPSYTPHGGSDNIWAPYMFQDTSVSPVVYSEEIYNWTVNSDTSRSCDNTTAEQELSDVVDYADNWNQAWALMASANWNAITWGQEIFKRIGEWIPSFDHTAFATYNGLCSVRLGVEGQDINGYQGEGLYTGPFDGEEVSSTVSTNMVGANAGWSRGFAAAGLPGSDLFDLWRCQFQFDKPTAFWFATFLGDPQNNSLRGPSEQDPKVFYASAVSFAQEERTLEVPFPQHRPWLVLPSNVQQAITYLHYGDETPQDYLAELNSTDPGWSMVYEGQTYS